MKAERVSDDRDAICEELQIVAGEWVSSFGSVSAAALCWAIRDELMGEPVDGYPPALEVCEALLGQEADPELAPEWVERTRAIAGRAKEYILQHEESRAPAAPAGAAGGTDPAPMAAGMCDAGGEHEEEAQE